jgi:hypothetical protein
LLLLLRLILAHILVPDQKLYLWWYDKQHCFQSKGINFFESLPHFVVLIALFQRLESQHWGLADQSLRIGISEVAPAVVPPASTSRPSLRRNAKEVGQAKMAENLLKEISIQVGDHTFKFMFDALKTDFVLFGRSTSTVEAVNLSDGKKYLLKFSWQESHRPREAIRNSTLLLHLNSLSYLGSTKVPTKSKDLALYVSSHSISSNRLPLFKARRSGKHIGK